MTDKDFLVGRGIADITGEAADCELLGYGKSWQRSAGLHTRLRSRAFVIDDGERRVLLIVCDLPLMFPSVHREVLARLAVDHGERYTEVNVMITVTHTHCGPGGYGHHGLYNLSNGFHPKTFAAIVDGIVEAAGRAHADLAPARLTLAHGELHDASVNRSRVAFDRNPPQDREFFPEGIDPQTTVLRIERDGRPAGMINWFATHGTSLTNRNLLISSDNKGYAALHWERDVEGGDYLARPEPDFVAAFAQTNAGDMSPNVGGRPGSGPTADEFENARIVGLRQYDAAAKLMNEPGVPVRGGVDHRLTYVDLSAVEVSAEFGADGRAHRTRGPIGGAAALAGTDEGKGFPGFRQQRNPVWDTLSAVLYRLAPRLRDAQSPKGMVLPGGLMNRLRPFIATRFPVQLLRVGPLYLLGIPGEVTIVAGLRLRRTVAELVGAELENVLVAGYSNGYFHYVTTPEEYQAQRYEGGSTLFGRWQLDALRQTAASLARALRDGTPVERGTPEPDFAGKVRPVKERAVDGSSPGRVLTQPAPSYRPGERAGAGFVGAYPNNDLRRGGTYLTVESEVDGTWRTIADDGDWSTKFHWSNDKAAGPVVTITWDIPLGATGQHRIRYHGDVQGPGGRVEPFTAVSDVFEIG
ncbi:neutral/alkaline non-lysosomal ceramidase N-terminal domain-containing protein [Amycolatopsis sp. H20-H5]|uniref:neutral/alkaline non-lysosomal ceramidase N-terminal domain-containing protein n=1 Tax=Amycolatopsis sp. H20-H5 TaxID=3046309 RepID=UPI002DB5A643|nr:neutral/alkaline non-lysosomal ceramidase N-terminal domain-containing protein [Amycolatopsis sp. H20-H5]MEC3975914.1 neutral/alkaline non-lysosomal ceramidase N-terminal domain-containing protein [Amycolatopsis sp. H20-H5]